jgi:DNA polymerase elongation subunit (family B)
MIVNIQQNQNQLIISYIKKDGTIGFNKINIPPSYQYNWKYTIPSKADKKYISWDGKPVQRVLGKFFTNTRIQEFFIQAGDSLKHLFDNNFPNLYSCDIETEVTDEYSFVEPSDATNKITTIAWSRFPEVYVFGLKQLSGEEIQKIEDKINDHLKPINKKYNLIYKQFKTERELLYDFLYNYARHAPLITGWNFWNYDWQYIYNRCKILNLDISWMSPTKQWFPHKIMEKGIRNNILLPVHKLIIDYQEIYKKWDRTVDPKENFTLDFAAEQALGIKKVRYKGTFKDLYEDFSNHVFYNAIDTILVEQLHYKIKTMNIMLTLANITRSEIISALSPINMLENVLAKYAYSYNKVFPKKNNKNEKEKYEGAFVFKPIPGLKKWVASFDYASLYPSIMRQFMISIENYLGKNKNYKPKDHEIKTKSGAIFDKRNNPLLPEILTDFYGKRKDTKKVEVQAELEIDALKQILKEKKNKI